MQVVRPKGNFVLGPKAKTAQLSFVQPKEQSRTPEVAADSPNGSCPERASERVSLSRRPKAEIERKYCHWIESDRIGGAIRLLLCRPSLSPRKSSAELELELELWLGESICAQANRKG